MNVESSHRPRSRMTSYILLAAGCVLLMVAYLAGISDNPPGITAMLAGMFAVVLGIACFFSGAGNRGTARHLLLWAPRSLCIVIALFLAMFALDVFGGGGGFWHVALALVLHLIPSLLVLLFLALTWRREWVGALLFFALAAFYAVSTWDRPFARSAIPLISGPLALTGALFLVNWRNRRKLPSRQ
jgi:hypothetical protein